MHPDGRSVERGNPSAELYAAADLVTPMAIRVAATLRIADHLGAGPRTAPDLARAAGTDAETLDRLLRHLAAAGVLRHDDAGTYALTPRGEVLRDDHPAGLRELLDIEGPIGRAELSFVQLLHAVRSGEAAFPVQFGRSFWDDLTTDQDRSARYDARMGADVAAWAPAILAAYDWGSLTYVMDVGGGNGTLLTALLTEHPALRGTVFDQPATADAAREHLVAAGLAARADAVAGSFFDALPSGADAYVLTAIIHDWDDASARMILRRCADAAGSTGRVLVIEKIGADGASPGSEMDLRMLAYLGGKERSPAELSALADSAGCSVAAVHRAGAIVILELTAA